MAQAPAQYPFPVASISQLHPAIPANIVHNLHLGGNIAIGDHINLFDAKKAEGAATSLVNLQIHEQAITDEVIETAKNHATIIRSAHGQFQFQQPGNAAILALLNDIHNTVNGLDQRFTKIEVIMENARIVKRNQHLRSLGPGQVYGSRRKEVIGSGTALAQQIHGGAALPPNIDINPPANVGTAPPDLNPFSATNNDILRLISFYNDTFGIIDTDNLATCHEKLIHWLTERFF